MASPGRYQSCNTRINLRAASVRLGSLPGARYASAHGQRPVQWHANPSVDGWGSPSNVPNTAQAYVFNATLVPVGSLGHLTRWPDRGDQPNVSTLNPYDRALTSNIAIVPAGNNGEIDAYADGLTNLILDISGYFAP